MPKEDDRVRREGHNRHPYASRQEADHHRETGAGASGEQPDGEQRGQVACIKTAGDEAQNHGGQPELLSDVGQEQPVAVACRPEGYRGGEEPGEP